MNKSSPITCLIALLMLAAAAPASAQVPPVNPAFPTNLTGTPGTLLWRQINHGRVTNIAWHNGNLYTHLVGYGNPRRWRFTNPADVNSLTNEATGGGNVGNFADHGTHGHYKVGEYMGGLYGVNIRRQSEGVNVVEDLPGFQAILSTQPGDEMTRMYYPWGVAFNWIEYGARTGYGYLYRGPNEPLAEWPMLAQDGVAGNSILLGNLLIVTSDESNMGILCYDISPVFQDPPQQPQLLDKLSGPLGAYIVYPWEHYLVLARRDTSTVDIVDFSDPTNLTLVTSIDTSGNQAWDRGNGLGYVQCQDNFIFTDRHKIDMDTFQSVLELDEMDVGGRPAGSIAGQLDTSQHLMPLGNLLVSGGYSVAGADGIGVWIHDSNPDTNPPYVGYHVPRPGQTNFPLGAPVSLLIHENLESYTIINGTSVILRPVGGSAVDATVSFSYDDVLTITPTSYLEPDTTYEVEIVDGGIKDVSGNGIVGYSFSFSTGGSVAGGNASPQIQSFNANPSPATPGTDITLSAFATDADAGDVLEYRFTFGEAGAVRDWSTDATASHTYTTSGHFGVKVQVRDVRTGTPLSTVSQTGTVTVADAPPTTAPTKSSPIALDAAGRRVWVVNPDNDSVSVIDPDTRVRLAEHDLQTLTGISTSIDPRSVAVDGAGNAWITCRDADLVIVLNPVGALVDSIDVGYGSAPMGMAITPDGSTAFVSLESRGELRRYDTTTRSQNGSVALGPMPRAIAITADGSRVLVTRFISTEEYGQVYDVDAAAMTLTRSIPLVRDRGRDGSSAGRGVPNFVSGITISPLGDFAYFTAVKANTQRGTFFDQGQGTNAPLDPDNSVRSMVGRVDLTTNNEPFVGFIDSYRIDVDNSDSPTSIEFSPSGDYFFVSIQGNNNIAVFDDLLLRTLPRSVSVKTTKGRFATGLAPQGLAFDAVTNRLFSTDFMGRSVTVHDLDAFFAFGNRDTDRQVISKIDAEALSAEVLLGKQIFYQAEDGSGLSTLPTMSLEGYISCASCHVDGQHDGMTWDFTHRGEGFRNTTDLRGRGGVAQGNVHWTGNFDEVQDFILDIANEFGGGGGFLPFGEAPHASLGAPNAGRSVELDALAAYVTSLSAESLPRSPHRNSDGTATADAVAGAAVFAAQNCASCHSGSNYTDSALGAGLLHNVGTQRTSSGQRLGGPLPGIDTPTLLGLWANAPYFHDGSAKSLAEVFRVAGGTIYQAEAATLGAGAYLPTYPTLNEDSSMHGQMVYLNGGDTVTFENVDGGSGGLGDIEFRWNTPYWSPPGTLTVSVNGAMHPVPVARPFGSGQPGNHWQRLRIEDVNLTAGPTNMIVFTTDSLDDSGLDDVLVTTADDRAAAAAHRSVSALSAGDQEDLMAYLLQLDSQSAPSPSDPNVLIALSPGQRTASLRPFAEFDITFTEPVSGLAVDDFVRGGSAGSSASLLMTLAEGTHYRLRVAGFSQTGSVTVRLPGGMASAVDDGAPNAGSNTASIHYTPVLADDLAPLSDEFDDSGTIGNWQRNHVVEGWGAGADKFETWDIDATRAGHMRIMPVASTWYNSRTGSLAFKEVTGDFVATARLEASRRNGQPGRPASNYTWAGMMVRAPRALTNAAPVPDPGPGVVLPWPPDGSYTTGWNYQPENYLYLASGYGTTATSGNPNLWHFESKLTTNSMSDFYGGIGGIPENENVTHLQIVRAGQAFMLLRRHGDGSWIIQERYTTPNLPATVQIGLTAYSDYNSIAGLHDFHHNRIAPTGGNPDIVGDFDFFRIQRPHEAITQAALQNVSVTGQFGSLSQLGDTAVASLLGDNAHTPYEPPGETYDDWMTAHLTPSQLVHPAQTDPSGDADGNGLPNGIDFVTGGSGTAPVQIEILGPSEARVVRLTLTRNTAARGVTLIVESTTDFVTWTPHATSIDGAPPTGTASIHETGDPIRTLQVEVPQSVTPTFYRARVVIP